MFSWSESLYNHASFTLELLRLFADLTDAVDFSWSAACALKKKLIISVSIQSIEKKDIKFIQIRWGMNNITSVFYSQGHIHYLFIATCWVWCQLAVLWLRSCWCLFRERVKIYFAMCTFTGFMWTGCLIGTHLGAFLRLGFFQGLQSVLQGIVNSWLS